MCNSRAPHTWAPVHNLELHQSDRCLTLLFSTTLFLNSFTSSIIKNTVLVWILANAVHISKIKWQFKIMSKKSDKIEVCWYCFLVILHSSKETCLILATCGWRSLTVHFRFGICVLRSAQNTLGHLKPLSLKHSPIISCKLAISDAIYVTWMEMKSGDL